MLSRLFKPKWQHKDPAVRLAAIAEIADPAVVHSLASDDPDAGVRQAAIRRIGRIDALLKLHAHPEDAAVVDARIRELLAKHPETHFQPALAERLERLADPALLATLAARAHDARLRLAAVVLLQDQALLARAAAEDDSADVRYHAAQRLSDESLIRSALKQLGKKDKRTAQTLRERLDAVQAERERAAQIDALIAKAGELGNDLHWQREQTQLFTLQTEWSELQPHATDAQRATFAQATETARQRIDQRRQEAEAIAPAREAKEDQCRLVEAFSAELAKRHRLSPDEATEIEATLDAFAQDWAELAFLPEAQEAPLANRFHAALADCRRQVETLRRTAQRAANLERLLHRAEQLRNHTVIHQHAVDKLEAEWRAEPQIADRELAHVYREQFGRVMADLRARLADQAEARKRGVEQIYSWLATIEGHLDNDQLGDSLELQKRIQVTLEELVDVAPKDRQHIEQRLRQIAPRLRELSGWRHWGTDRAREELIEEAEALTQREDLDVPSRAKAVRELRERWKKLGAIDPAAARRLWERFDAACTAAYAPCQAHYQAEAEARNRHREARALICAEIEAIARDTDWNAPDWRATDKYLHQLQHRWNEAGPVGRRDWEALLTRYHAALDAVNRHLDGERRADRARREALINQLEQALADMDERPADVLRLAREAQQAWHPTVTGKRNEEQRLWKRFRAALDAIYARDRERRDAAESAVREQVAAKEALCAELEAVARAPADAERRLADLRARWEATPLPSGKPGAQLERRYEQALRAVTEVQRRQRGAAAAERFDRLVARHGAIEALEQAALRGAPPGEREALAEAARATPAAGESNWDSTCDARLASAQQATGESAALAKNARTREQLLLDLEILLHLESPPESAEARMQRQVERLASVLTSGSSRDFLGEVQALASQFCGVGPVDAETSEAQAPRFARIARRIREEILRAAR